ncbi:hypothetical protein K505DRAFT_397592 [Melanomma pulvis-pyrius CBS 109.77]|uniref:Uncharacterized protein n=1 Tax=Melanomma pulvis-pyrius CBS 109.77 TaxID=1314802 RepID=A0A6A6XNF3_9PLEO|nr:hypothetical protein K505DRAFT_397592 [Melanomma pulvis-pyrius CBS 109.77]
MQGWLPALLSQPGRKCARAAATAVCDWAMEGPGVSADGVSMPAKNKKARPQHHGHVRGGLRAAKAQVIGAHGLASQGTAAHREIVSAPWVGSWTWLSWNAHTQPLRRAVGRLRVHLGQVHIDSASLTAESGQAAIRAAMALLARCGTARPQSDAWRVWQAGLKQFHTLWCGGWWPHSTAEGAGRTKQTTTARESERRRDMLNCSNFLVWEASNLAVISSWFMVPGLAELDSASRIKRVAMALGGS